MKVTVVYGTMRKGSTYNCVKIFLNQLNDMIAIDVAEFFLPKDLPHFCYGCFSCFLNGEETCPHNQSVQRIAQELEEADLIILASPVYGCDVSGQMKVFLDHLCYRWMSHRPHPTMFHKIGLVVSTTAGAGTAHTNKTMKKSLQFWGINRIYSFGKAVAAMRYEDIVQKKQLQLQRKLVRLAKKVAKAMNRQKKKPTIFTRILFWAMSGMQKGNNWNITDRNHWKEQGWLDGRKPW